MGYLWIKFGRKVIDMRKAESYKDTHLTWKLSDDIVMVLFFDCHSRFLLLAVSLCISLCVALKLISCCAEYWMGGIHFMVKYGEIISLRYLF